VFFETHGIKLGKNGFGSNNFYYLTFVPVLFRLPDEQVGKNNCFCDGVIFRNLEDTCDEKRDEAGIIQAFIEVLSVVYCYR